MNNPDPDVAAGAVLAYFGSLWEATRTLVQTYEESTGDLYPHGRGIPAWVDLPRDVQLAVIEGGLPLTDQWDTMVLSTSEHHLTGGHPV